MHNTQYGIRNAQSLSRQRYVNTEQGQSVRSQSIRNVNRISHVSQRERDDQSESVRVREGGARTRYCERGRASERERENERERLKQRDRCNERERQQK